MAFDPRHFVICSKFPLFKASCNLWLYTTSDSLEDCLAENYFQPRMNTKNQDSPEVGDIIQCIVGNGTLAYLSIIAKTEKPYNITVEKTYLENEAAIYDAIYTAADKGEQLYQTGVWYAKMYSDTVVPTGSEYEDRNYADFSQVDSDDNPIIVIYEYRSGAWVETQRITPPTEYNGYLPITSKFWDIEEQTGQQGGEVLWSYNTKRFTPFPRIISYDSIHVTGDSTVVIPDNPSSIQIVNKDYVDSAIAAIPTPTVDIVQSPDAEIVGTLTIASNGDVTGFSQTDYLVMPGALNMTNSNSFELMFAFATGMTASSAPILKNAATGYGTQSEMGLSTDSNSKLYFFVNGTTSVYLTGTTTVQPNTKYYAKLVYDGTDYTLSLSEDGTNWTLEATGLATSIPGILRETKYALGIWSSSNGISTLYLSECYIKKNGILIWQGMDAPGLHQRVATGHEVIEFQAPTAANNNTWYRKYADGWVEQGQYKLSITKAQANIVTLPVPMANTNFGGIISCANTTYNTATTLSIDSHSTTQVNLWCYTSASASTIEVSWEVKGMYAQ